MKRFHAIKEATGRRTSVLAVLVLSALLHTVPTVQAIQKNDALTEQRGEIRLRRDDKARRHDLLHVLDLSPDQIEQIKTIRERHKDEWRAARQRLGQAQRALDEAIYADTADEALIEERAREMAAAQAAVTRMRALTELSIRRVLTPEQLNTLRDLRQRARAAGWRRRPESGDGERPLRHRFRRRPETRMENDGSGGPGLSPRNRRGDLLRQPRP